MLTKEDFLEIRKIIKEEVAEETEKVIAKAIKPIKEDIVKIKKNLDAITLVFDKEFLDLRKRVDRIEQHLHLPSQ